jgi:autotransporter-associated beta strand protein
MNEKMRKNGPLAPLSLAALTAALWPLGAFAQTTQDIRIVTYNTQGDVSSPTPTGVLPYLTTTLEGVGQEQYVGDNILQLPDIIALEETTSNSTTVVPVVNNLNSYYGSNIFASSTYQATQSGGNTDGNGPNALIYNQNRINLLASVGVGTPGGSSNGEYRQVVRYEFQPIADVGSSNGEFYVYVCHAKSLASGSISTDQTYQKEEATIIRNNEATLPSTAAVLYVGDWNVDASTDPSMVEMSSSGQGQAFDALNPTNQSEDWAENSAYQGILTESDTDLRYRDDLQLMTSNVLNDSPGVLGYVANSAHSFGNNGNTAVYGTINSGSNTAINDILGHGSMSPINPAVTVSGVFNAMNGSIGSDHLPVVADYSLALPTQNLTWDNAGTSLVNDGMTWDINHFLNWNSGSNASTYTEGSNVTFNDSNNNNYNVTLNTTVNPASVTVNNNSGNYSISGTGTIAGTGSLTKNGVGTLTLSTANTFSGGTNVNAGLLQINPTGPTTSALPAGAVSISGSGTLQLSNNVTLGSQSSNTPVTAPTSNVNISSLSIAGDGTLDITNNHIIINYGSGPDPIQSIAALVASGYAGGSWNGTGIISSTAQLNFASYGIGYADAADTGNPAGLSSGQIEIMYTLLGDANLDGKVNGTDFTIMATNFNQAVTAGWDRGDFNYDGAVNGSDFVALARQFNQAAVQSAVSAADLAALNAFGAANGLETVVPEPGSIGLLLVAGVGILARRRRSIFRGV